MCFGSECDTGTCSSSLSCPTLTYGSFPDGNDVDAAGWMGGTVEVECMPETLPSAMGVGLGQVAGPLRRRGVAGSVGPCTTMHWPTATVGSGTLLVGDRRLQQKTPMASSNANAVDEDGAFQATVDAALIGTDLEALPSDDRCQSIRGS